MIPLRDDNPITVRPILTIGLIAVNVLVFFYQISLGPQAGQLFVYRFGAIPAVLFGIETLPPEARGVPPPLSLFTSMFLHGGLMHLAGNMLYLWIFGNNIEEAMGRLRFTFFYFLCGVIAAMSHALTSAGSVVPMIGASGAISGILGAYILLYPHAQVLTLIPLGFFMRIMYIPAGWVLGLWFLLQLLSGGMAAGQKGGGVAFFAHIGGFVAGMALVGPFKRRSVRFFNPPHHHAWRFKA
ncbi:MAG TPA: rhomboid family intramembrane serine protease [Candidatus Manganitrophaceae bacterium]|nr:rhomboid family intramembrane serine protease [Candidatus Manganitrophaceae bacterium]